MSDSIHHTVPSIATHTLSKSDTASPVSKDSQRDSDESKKTAAATYFKDTVSFSLGFTWESDNLKPDTKPSFFTTILTTPIKWLRPALSIYITPEKAAQLMQDYDGMIVQSRSPNVLLATYARAKLNGLAGALMMAGIDYATLEARRRKILDQAIRENKEKFADNEYNIEMMMLVSNKKSRFKLVKSLKKIRKELMIHMKKLGQPDWYSPLRCNTICAIQVDRIIAAFTEESETLSTQLTYWHGYSSDQSSITVRLSETDIDSEQLLTKKKSKLNAYIKLLNQRQAQLAYEQKRLLLHGRLSDKKIIDYESLLGLRSTSTTR